MDYAKLKQDIAPYRGVLRFVLVLLVAHFFWKFTVVGDECGDAVTFFGCDISAPFILMSAHIANVVYAVLGWLGYDLELTGTTIFFANGHGVSIIWGCSGLKQMFIFACILLTARGPWQHKLWFVPMGMVACYAINMVRITLLTMVVCHHPEWFHVLHEYVLKYLFYGIIFMFWVWWEERFNREGAQKPSCNRLSR